MKKSIFTILFWAILQIGVFAQKPNNEAIVLNKDINAERVLIRFTIPAANIAYFYQVRFVTDDPNIKATETTGTGKILLIKRDQELEASWFFTRPNDRYTFEQIQVLNSIEIEAINTHKKANDYRPFLNIAASALVATGGALLMSAGAQKARDAQGQYDHYARNTNPFNTGNPDFPLFRYESTAGRDSLFASALKGQKQAQTLQIAGIASIASAGAYLVWTFVRKRHREKNASQLGGLGSWQDQRHLHASPILGFGGLWGLGIGLRF